MKSVISAIVLATALTGCVTTGTTPGGTTSGVGSQSKVSVLDRLQMPSGFGESKVALLMDVGTKPFMEGKQFAESFSVLPVAKKGSKEFADTMSLMSKVGDFLAKHREIEAYVYTPAVLFQDESVIAYRNALEAKAGQGRVNIKADARLASVKNPVLWVSNPKLAAAPDALLGMEKRGLAATVLQ